MFNLKFVDFIMCHVLASLFQLLVVLRVCVSALHRNHNWEHLSELSTRIS